MSHLTRLCLLVITSTVLVFLFWPVIHISQAAGVTTPSGSLSDPTSSLTIPNIRDSIACMGTITVTNNLDSGSGTLRQALANICNGGTIKFAAKLANKTIVLTSTELSITKTVTITNPKALNLKISGNNSRRVFHIKAGAVVTISNLSIINGARNSAHGGGILNKGVIALNNIMLSSNSAYLGGGIYNEGTLLINDSVLNNNWSSALGGGIYNLGTLVVNRSNLNNNSADSQGGGIYHLGSSTVTINDSTISDNLAHSGGGISNNEGSVAINSSAIENNIARNGGGISNQAGSLLTIINSTFNNNSASDAGAIFNRGSLTVDNSSFSHNSVQFTAGAIINTGVATVSHSNLFSNTSDDYLAGGIRNSGVLTLSHTTLDSNSASTGGGILNEKLLTIYNSTFSNNLGGGISNRGTLTLNNSVIKDNSSNSEGGGISTIFGKLTINNSTFSSNSTTSNGGGIYSYRSVITFNNNTFSDNSANKGGGLYNNEGTLSLYNTIIANSNGEDCVNTGTIASNFSNLIEDSSCNPTLFGDPNLGPLQNNGGGTLTYALLPGSPAIDAGGATCLTTDQRNVSRPIDGNDDGIDICDIGAYEAPAVVSNGPKMQVEGNNTFIQNGDNIPSLNDHTDFGSAPVMEGVVTHTFTISNIGLTDLLLTGSPLVVLAGDKADFSLVVLPTTPVSSGSSTTFMIKFTPTAAGLRRTTLTIANNDLSRPLYSFSIQGTGDTSCSPAITVVSKADSGPGTLRQAIAETCSGGTINFAPELANQTIVLDSTQLSISKSLIITNSHAHNLKISGNNTHRVFYIEAGVAITISHLNITKGSAYQNGGGIYNQGRLALIHTVINDNNTASNGGGFYNKGIAVIDSSTFSNNEAHQMGGGISNSGILTITNSSLKNNSTNFNGGGISTFGPLTIINSTLSGNSADLNVGGAIYGDEMMTIINSTLSGNSANSGGGIYKDYNGDLIIKNSTIVSNSAEFSGGGIEVYELYLSNSILANNINGDCYADKVLNPSLNNLIEDGRCKAALSGDPKLGPLQNNGGSTLTHTPLPGSKAIDAGDAITCLLYDQQGNPRPLDGDHDGVAICDIGAVEAPGESYITPDIRISGNNILIRNKDTTPSLGDHTDFGLAPIGEGVTRTFTISNVGATDLLLSSSPRVTITGHTTDFTLVTSPTTPIGSDSYTTFQVRLASTAVKVSSATLTIANNDPDSSPYTFDVRGTSCLPFVTVTSANDQGAGTLRQALKDICSGGVIDFAPTLADQTITLISSGLKITKTVTITNPHASNLKISGNNAHRVFHIAGVVTITNLYITNGIDKTLGGGGILNTGTLTLDHCTLSNNSAYEGGGIKNGGALIIRHSIFTENSAIGFNIGTGGGIYNYGQVTVNNSLFINNSTTSNGGAITNYGGTLTIRNSIFNDNEAHNYGGGIYNHDVSWATTTLSIDSSTFNSNSASAGGGIYNLYNDAVEIHNSTFTGNSALNGGGLYNWEANITVNNSTFSNNKATYGGGIFSEGILNLSNSIIANSVDGNDCAANVMDININNLVEDGGCNSTFAVDPKLGPLQYNGGSMLTHALLPGSPAIDAGDNPTCLATDQRGFSRPIDGNGDGIATCDIGAYEALVAPAGPITQIQGNNKLILDGDTTPSLIDHTDFGSTWVMEGTVTRTFTISNTGLVDLLLTGSPLVTITGDSADFSLVDLPTTPISPGNSTTFTVRFDPTALGLRGADLAIANNDPGKSLYSFSIQGTGKVPCKPSITVTSKADGGPDTLRQAVVEVCNGGNIKFASELTNQTIVLTSAQLNISKNLTITNPHASNLKISGNNAHRVFHIQAGGAVTISNLSIISGRAASSQGGGIYNKGTLTLDHIELRHNFAGVSGGGIFNQGVLTINHSTLKNNSSTDGGSLSNEGTAEVDSSILSHNSANNGGGIYNYDNGLVIINNSTFNSNSAGTGGAIFNRSTNSVTIINSTLRGNSATMGGGIRQFVSTGKIIINNSTLEGNSAQIGGGIDNASGILHLRNSIIAHSSNGHDCNSRDTIATNLNNLIEDGSCNPAFSGDPNLGPLANNGGSTPTHALLPGSPAINAGDPASCLAVDQRGTARPQLGRCDIGAFESRGFILTMTGGNNQTTPTGMAFDFPLQLTVTSRAGDEPVTGGRITFTAPMSGPSATFAPATTKVISGNTVSLNVVANTTAGGPYTIKASARGVNPISFNLTNQEVLTLPSVYLPFIVK